jgi:hypothetical protein
MPAVSLSGEFNTQQFTDGGVLAALYRLYTYEPATTTHKAVYTEPTGTTTHTYVSDGLGGQYIALNARGELPAPIFLQVGGYDLTLKTPAGATVWTRRAVGIADEATTVAATVLASLANTASAAAGDALIGVKRTETGAQATTLHLWIQRSKMRLTDFGAVADGATDDTTAWGNALAAVTTYGGGEIELPIGTTCITAKQTLPENLTLTGQGKEASIIKVNAGVVGFEAVYATHTDVNRLNLVMRNLGFTGAVTALGAVKLDLVDYFDFENVSFKGFQAAGAYGARLVQAWRGGFRLCHWEDIDAYGVLMETSGGVGCNQTWIEKSEIIGNNEVAFIGALLRGQNVTVYKTDITGAGNGLHGLVLEGTEGCTIERCYIERWTGQAVKANSGTANSRTLIHRNVINSVAVPCMDFDHAGVNSILVVTENRFPDMGVGQTCVDVGTTTGFIEHDNDPDASNMTDTYTPSNKGGAQESNTFTATLTGCTTAPTGTVRFIRDGQKVTLYIPQILATSNTTACTLTGLPTRLIPTRDQIVFACYRNNGVDAAGLLQITTAGGMVFFNDARSSTFFTAAGAKGALDVTLTYSLD